MAVGLLETGERYTSHSWWFLHIIHTSYTPTIVYPIVILSIFIHIPTSPTYLYYHHLP
jgi:hypothetical protein